MVERSLGSKPVALLGAGESYPGGSLPSKVFQSRRLVGSYEVNRRMTSDNSTSFAGSGHGSGLPETGLLRLASILAPRGPIPVGKSTWWDGVKSGRFPQPVKLGPRVTAWRVEDIRALVDRGV